MPRIARQVASRLASSAAYTAPTWSDIIRAFRDDEAVAKNVGVRSTVPTIDRLARALSGAFLRRSVAVTALVGSILNVINQWEAWFGDAPIAWTKLLLTYCVPFCVATYATFSTLETERERR